MEDEHYAGEENAQNEQQNEEIPDTPHEHHFEAHHEQKSQLRFTSLNREDFDMNVIQHWRRIHAKNPPKRRSNHSAFIYDEVYLYIVGGVDISERKQGDIYRVDLSSEFPEWEKIELEGDIQLEKIAYHSGVLHNGVYYIIGGQDETLHTINKIQKFDVANNTMLEPIVVDEQTFPGLESHSCTLYNNKVIIYGGNSKAAKLDENGNDKANGFNMDVYCLDLETQEIKNLTAEVDYKNMPKGRADHAAGIMGGKLYVFGGVGKGGKKLDDLWTFSIEENVWEQVKFGDEVEEIEKEDKVKRAEKTNFDKTEEEKKENDENNQEEAQNDEKKEEKEEQKEEEQKEEEQKEEVKINRPQPRHGHSMAEINGRFFIFGGKVDVIMETNELWSYAPGDAEYTLIHDTLIEQFSPEELKEVLMHEHHDKKPFHWLTRGEVEKRTNPILGNPNTFKLDQKKKKADSKEANQKQKEEEEEEDPFAELRGKYYDQMMQRNGIVKIVKSLCYRAKTDEIKEKIKKSFRNEILNEEVPDDIVGDVPEPRDGQTVLPFHGNFLLMFGGDRNKFPFNDIYSFDVSGYDGKQEDEEEGENAENK